MPVSPRMSRYFYESAAERATRRDDALPPREPDTPLDMAIGPFRLTHRTVADAWRWHRWWRRPNARV
jgi:hypothetical protein